MLVVQWIEHLVAVQAVGGSNPLEHAEKAYRLWQIANSQKTICYTPFAINCLASCMQLSLIKKFLSSYVAFRLSLLVGGKNTLFQKDYELKTVSLQNKQLAAELQDACRKNDGFLTYAEYLAVDQFGTHGYHNTHTEHGLTDTHSSWGKAIVMLCKKQDIRHVIDFGCGDGTLGIAIASAAQKKGYSLTWSGVEINKSLHSTIQQRFHKKELTSYLKQLVTSPKELEIQEKCLVVFSYSLDSMPPEIFINTQTKQHFPTSLIGITVKHNILQEIALTPSQLEKKGISLHKGMYIAHGKRFDVSSWKLYNGQRAYIPIAACTLLATCTQQIPVGSQLLILDEFRLSPLPLSPHHFGIPHDLHVYTPVRAIDRKKAYEQTGQALLYYPFYFTTFKAFLSYLGFKNSTYAIEKKFAKELAGEQWKENTGFYYTYAFLTPPKQKNPRYPLPILFPKE